MKAAELLIKTLEDAGVKTVFGYPGGAILPFYDALYDSNLEHILVRNEQGAALAADGYARASGEIGVCVATSGPGATNLVTGIANAYLDSVPMLAITGQVPSPMIGTDAFQEVDIVGITMPIVKHSYRVLEADKVEQTVKEALHLAQSGRPGPVLLDIPKDVLNTEVQPQAHRETDYGQPETLSLDAVNAALDLIKSAQRPLIYGGGGIALAKVTKEFQEFVEVLNCPTVLTLKGLGALPSAHELFLGMLGMHGLKTANYAVQNCDLLLCIGARFDDRVTGLLEEFAPEARVVHLDVDPAEVGKRRHPDVAVIGSLQKHLTLLTEKSQKLDVEGWRQKCLVHKTENYWRYDPPNDFVYAPRLIRDISLTETKETFVTCDVGQHQMWVAQHYLFKRPENHLTSGGLGTMGYGLPAAIGATLARPDAHVINITGDGSFMMNVQELATIKRYNLPVKVIVLDNQCLGMVRQWQELFLEERYSETDLSDNPDFVKLSEGFGIPAFRVEETSQVEEAIHRVHNDDGPLLVHVVLDKVANVWPFVPPGKSNSVMWEENPNERTQP